MSRVLILLKMGCRNRTEARRSRGEVEKKSQKAEEGSAVERQFETGLWPTKRGSALWQTGAHEAAL
jgi:uncharacterized cupin superfamily protein